MKRWANLLVLASLSEPVWRRLSDVADITGLQPSSVAKILSRFVDEGLVEKLPCIKVGELDRVNHAFILTVERSYLPEEIREMVLKKRVIEIPLYRLSDEGSRILGQFIDEIAKLLSRKFLPKDSTLVDMNLVAVANFLFSEGYFAIGSYLSRGIIDVIAIKDGWIRLIQVKGKRGVLKKPSKERIITIARWLKGIKVTAELWNIGNPVKIKVFYPNKEVMEIPLEEFEERIYKGPYPLSKLFPPSE